MSLSGTVDYWDLARKNSAAKESWLIKLFYDNEDAADYIGISDTDVTIDSIFYHGIVTDFGEITESLDLLKSKASIGNVDITCQNTYRGKEFSKELWPNTGSQNLYYINRKVEIYSRFGDTTAIAKCRLIYEGRLFNFTQTVDSIVLHIEEKKPQDFIQLATTKSTDGKVTFPVVYGNYTASGNAVAAETLVDNKAVWPLEVHSIIGEGANAHFYCVDGINQTHNWHFYEESLDTFHEIEEDGLGGTVTAFKTGFVDPVKCTCRRGFIFEANIVSATSAGGDTETWADTENAIDGDETTDASVTVSKSIDAGGSPYVGTFKVEFPSIDGTFDNSQLDARMYYSITVTTGDGGAMTTALAEHDVFANLVDFVTGVGTQADGWSSWFNDVDTDYTTNKEIMNPLEFRVTINEPGGAPRSYASVTTLSNVQLSVVAQYDWDGDLNGLAGSKDIDQFNNSIEKIKFLYSSNDGYDQVFTNAPAPAETATLPHQIFRDMLNRFAGFDVATANMIGYADLDDARDGTDDAGTDWDCRFWIDKPTSLDDVLQQLQFEGGFIFKYYPSGGKFIFVKDNYHLPAYPDHVIYDTDYTNLETSLTPFSEIITDVDYQYQKHPAKSGYVKTRNFLNTDSGKTSRADYWPSIAAEENKTQITLDYLVDDPFTTGTDTNPNSCIAMYYDNIWADPKILVNCDIINPALFDLEIGDTVRFDDDYVKSGKSATVYYMVTETRRTIGGLSIQCREVGTS